VASAPDRFKEQKTESNPAAMLAVSDGSTAPIAIIASSRSFARDLASAHLRTASPPLRI
jgi:hypothetical protein